MKISLLLCTCSLAFLFLLVGSSRVDAQEIGIANGIPYPVSADDTVSSPYLPTIPTGEAGDHGFLQADGKGGFAFEDGTPARFFGVAVQGAACFPDSATAIVMAARLRKLGVNLVRFDYMDFSYVWAQGASFLDVTSGARSLNAGQMRKFDWFVYQLKKNGIYSYIYLQAARAPRAEDGLGTLADSALWVGYAFNYLYPQSRATHKLIAKLLMEHVNPFTNKEYRAEPAIAMVEIWKQGSLLAYMHINYINHNPASYSFSWNHSRRLDTLFADFLRNKYGTTAALTTAWSNPVPNGGYANRFSEGSFEGEYDLHWQIAAYDGTSLNQILTQDSVPDGKYALTLRTRNSQGNLTGAYMLQLADLGLDTLYQLIFKVKCSNPEGRQLFLYGAEAKTDALYAGLNQTLTVTPYWKEDTVSFLVPIRPSAPIQIGFYFGDADGEITFDDIRLRPFQPYSVVPGESLENSTITRIPWKNAATYLVSSQRMQDQAEFYIDLDRDYQTDLYRYVVDTLHAEQPVTGAGTFWASSFMELGTQSNMDFATSETGWDNASSNDGKFHINNNSILRLYYYTPGIYEVASRTLENQPMVVGFGQPFPNRYQAEGMLYLPAYSSLQGWDGIVWQTYLDNYAYLATDHADSALWYQMAKNPTLLSLMPAASYLFRNGLVSPAQTTVRLHHSEQQALLFPRMEQFWSSYAVPGGINGYGMASTRIVSDSLNSLVPTQASDIAFPTQSDGIVVSDTRQIEWNVYGSTLTINSPKAQGATGYLGRSDNVLLDNLEIDLTSGNETSTFLWVPLDSSRTLSEPGRSFLVIASRTEPTGMHWLDSTYTDTWGTGPMTIDPVRAALTFRFDTSVASVTLIPLDESGRVANQEPIVAKRTGNFFTATIDQRTTRAMWYAVEAVGGASDAPVVADASERALLSVYPNITSDRAFVEAALPSARESVDVVLYDPLGRRVATLHDGAAGAGRTGFRLDCHDLPAGAYHLQLRTERGETATATVHVVR